MIKYALSLLLIATLGYCSKHPEVYSALDAPLAAQVVAQG